MTDDRNLVNFDSVTALRKAQPGTYAHDGDRYPNMKFRVGKTKRSWTYRGRINGKFKSVVLGTFPTLTAPQAFKRIDAEKKHHGNEATAEIDTVRAAWAYHCRTSISDGKMTEKNAADMTSKLERWASDVLGKHPTAVSSIMIQNAINAIDTGRGDNSAATKRHVKAALSAAFRRLPGDNPVATVTVPEANERPPIWYDLCDMNPNLEKEDLSTVWRAIWDKRESNVILGTAWVVMFFTGIRKTDVCSLRWDPDGKHGWVSLQRGEATFPKLKSGVRNTTIPLPPIVVDALKAIRASSSEWVFPASSATGYVGGEYGLAALKAEVDGQRVEVIRPHDTRKFFQDACNEAMLPDPVQLFLRGDKGGNKSMLSKYTNRVGKSAPAMVQEVLLEQIKVTPAF